MQKYAKKRVYRKPYAKKLTARTTAGRITKFVNPTSVRGAYNIGKQVFKSGKVAFKTARKLWSSRTSTNTETKTNSTPINKHIAVGAKKTIKQTIYMGTVKGGRKSNIQYDHHYQIIHENEQGRQGIGLINNIMTNQTGVASTALQNRTNRSQYGTNLFDMTPQYQNSGPIYVASIDPVARMDAFFLNSIQSTLCVTNFTTVPGECRIYWCAPVRDHFFLPDEAWATSLADEAALSSQINPATYANSLTTSPQLNSGYPTTTTQYGFDPYECHTFKQKWNIKKTTNISLRGGETCNVITNIMYNKTITKTKNTDNPSDFITGQTLVPMVVFRFAPVIVNSTPPTEEVTYASGKFGFIHHQTLFMTMLTNRRMKVKRQFNGVVYSTGLAEKFVDEDGDAAINTEVGLNNLID